MPSEKDIVRGCQKIAGVTGGVVVSREDGTLLFKEEKTAPDTPEKVAFLGGATEVMTALLDLGPLVSALVEEEGGKLLIIPHRESFLGLEVGPAGPWWMETPEVGEILLGGKFAELEDVEKIFREKLKLLNLLVEEFSKGGNREEWLETIMAEVGQSDPAGKVGRSLRVSEGQIQGASSARTNVTKKEISEIFEKLVNLVCKRAIGAFGFVEVKHRFKGVIDKLAG
jgi:hypothetical protein